MNGEAMVHGGVVISGGATERPDRLDALNAAIGHARASAFYRNRLPPAGVKSRADFHRIPFTTKADLRREGPRGLICVPEKDLAQYHESSATTGAPISVFYSRRDLTEITERLAGWGVGFSAEDRVLVRFPYALSTIGHFVHAAAQARGACIVPADSRSTITPIVRVVDLLRRLDVTVLATISLSAVMIAEVAESIGLHPRRDFPALRAIACAGEPLSAHRREVISQIWGVPVLDNYGMTETGPMGMDCEARRAHPFTDLFFFEVLDERLEKEVAPGEIGQLVVTSLTKRAVPLVRYVTGDRVRRFDQRCRCGRTSTLEVRGRADETLSIDGRPFDLWTLSEIASRLPARRFWRVSPTAAGLRYVVEKERTDDAIDAELLSELGRDYGVRLEVELVPRGTLYDRTEPLSFGMTAKPIYIDPPRNADEARCH